MARQTFDPKPQRPRKAAPALPKVPGAPTEAEKKADMRHRVKMFDKLSVTWEPDWNEVLNELRVTRT